MHYNCFRKKQFLLFFFACFDGLSDNEIVIFKKLLGFFIGSSRNVRNDSYHTVAELNVGGLKVYHKIFVNVTLLYHNCGGDHIKDHLMGGTCLHTGRAGNYLSPRIGMYGNVGNLLYGTSLVAGKGDL